jgi:hypothetical protein
MRHTALIRPKRQIFNAWYKFSENDKKTGFIWKLFDFLNRVTAMTKPF